MNPLRTTFTLALAFCITAFIPSPAPGAGLFDALAEKRRDSVSEFDLAGDPATLAKTFVDARKTSALKGIKRVAIPSFQIEFALENSAKAISSSSFGSSSVKSSVSLVGIESAVFQKIADDLYDRLVADLTAAGIEVVPFEQVKANEDYQKFKAKQESSPHWMRTQDGRSLYYSAHGMPIYFHSNDQRFAGLSAIGQSLSVIHPQNYEKAMARELDAAILRVRLIVDIAKQSASGGLMRSSASVQTKAALNIMAQFSEYSIITPRNGTAELSLAKHMNSAEQIFELKKAKDLNVDYSALGGANTGKAEYVLVSPPDTYAKTVSAHLLAAHAMFMSVIKPNL